MINFSPLGGSEDEDDLDLWSAGDLADEELAAVIANALTDDRIAQTEAELVADLPRESSAKAVDRRAVDRRLVEMLEAQDFKGPVFEELYRRLTKGLMEYAWPIMLNWIETGVIFSECRKYRGRVHAPAEVAAMGWPIETRQEAAKDTLIKGCDFLLDYGLRRKKWDWQRGASLRTYYVGACVCCFIGVCNEYWKRQVLQEAFVQSAIRSEEDDATIDPLDMIPASGRAPDDIVADRDQATRIMATVTDPRLKHVLGRRMEGIKQKQAAEEIGITPKAAERRLHAFRKGLPPSGNPAQGGTEETERRG
jgi:hypothetical protein